MTYIRTQPTAACNRCGVIRQHDPKRNRSGLCKDCIGVLSREERALWAA